MMIIVLLKLFSLPQVIQLQADSPPAVVAATAVTASSIATATPVLDWWDHLFD